ncbi:hypothetical protein FK227_23005 [Salmonella enterica subsp. enterica serovar Chester]|nr:hypothetical protein [Salmonella enterica subsp. enterica serovar Chester]ECF4600425.1 hypothetical protein [Salmonella enterica subsp. enterica serovar Chester]
MTDTKKPAGLVPCGLSVLHRTYPDHHLVELAGVEPASEMLQLFVFIEIMLANKIRVAFAYPL